MTPAPEQFRRWGYYCRQIDYPDVVSLGRTIATKAVPLPNTVARDGDVPSPTAGRPAEDVDWIAPTDEELAAMTEKEILGPSAGREYLGGHYPVCLDSLAATCPPNMHNAMDRGRGVILSGSRAGAWK